MAKYRTGAVTQLDVDRAGPSSDNTREGRRYLAALQQTKNSLAILLGRPPQDLSALLQGTGIPSAPATVAVGMPQDLIRRRPDIRAAERRMAAQSAQIGVAITDLYPSLTIGGSIGTAALDSGDLFDSNSKVWDLFGVPWNLFNYGRRKQRPLAGRPVPAVVVDYLDTVLSAQATLRMRSSAI